MGGGLRDGEKMSKSKGNVGQKSDAYGLDAFRYSFLRYLWARWRFFTKSTTR